MFTADQLVAHLVGDYVLQSDWMANHKTADWFPALLHALAYSVCFLGFHPSPVALAAIIGTHYLIDRYRLARYVVWAKNRFLGDGPPWEACQFTGYPADRPAWLAVWLLIIADNVLHILINGLALRYL